MTVSLFILLVLSGGIPESSLHAGILPEGWIVDWGCLVSASGNGRWIWKHPVMDSTDVDAALCLTAQSPEVDFHVTGALRSDSTSTADLRRARAVVKWPGTPWIGIGLFFHDRQPFIPGLRDPIVEWGWMNIDSLQGYGFSSGGILGFKGEYLIQQTGRDTLTQMSIRSPWMGFVGLSYSRVHYHSTDLPEDENMVINSLIIESDFRYFEPWAVIAGAEGEEGRWALAGEIREFSAFRTDWGVIEVVPGIEFAGKRFSSPGNAFVPGQRLISLGAYLQSFRYAVTAGIKGMLDLKSDSLSGVSATAGMISESGITWDIEFDAYADGDIRALFGAGTADSKASARLRVEILEDSTRLIGMTSFTPREDVCAELTVSGNIESDIDPSCRLHVSTALGPVTGLLGIVWEQGSDVVLTLNLRGFFQ